MEEDMPEVAVKDGGGKQKKIKPGSFQGLGLNPATYKAIMKMGYNMPTPIQRKTIPTIMDGQDVVAMARTGSGKTAAFLIPVVERLQSHSVAVGFRAVALSPTRELAMQTAKFFRQLAKFTDLRCCLLVGGQAMEAQFEHLANNPDVVIATPGRLMHHIVEADLSLSRVEMIVFDEADRLFELGFAEQLEKITQATPLSRQCLLFSATLPSQLVSFTRAGLKDPIFVRLDVETTISDSLDLWYLYVRKEEKVAAAVSVLRFLSKPGKSTIMFVATRHHVEFFGDLLNKIGLSAAIVYGSMDQDQRTDQINKFRRKKASILVTTDVAARGIDVPLLDYVLNYDFPPSGKLFVHRAGRTARAGRSGLAVSLVTMDDLPYTVELMLFLGRKLHVTDSSPDGGQAKSAAEAGAEGSSSSSSCPLLGSLPPLEHDMEVLGALLEDEGSEIQAFYKSMLASYHLYNKTRPSASKQSVARAKQMVEDCGGPAQLQRLVHPAFRSLAGASLGSSIPGQGEVATATQEANLIQELRGFRPRAEKVGNVLSTGAMKIMEAAKLDATAVASALKSRAGDKESTDFMENLPAKLLRGGMVAHEEDSDDDEEEAVAEKGKKRKAKSLEPKPVERRNRVRMSKHQRMNMGKGSDASPGKKGAAAAAGLSAEDLDDGFDVSVDGVNLAAKAAQQASRTQGSKKKDQAPQFYLSVERDAQEEAKEKGLDMEQYQMDLMPDDSSDIKKAKSVVRWDAKKKKYLPVMVSVDGRVVKGSRRNESGLKVKGDNEKSNIYKKWVQSTKKRIQKVGEMEQAFAKPLSRRAQQEAAQQTASAASNIVEFDEKGAVKGESADGRKRKPVVPFYGEVEEKYLTNKQKRMMKRRERTDRVLKTSGKVEREVKSPHQIQKDKRDREKRQLKQNPKMRDAKREQRKEVKKKQREEKMMKYGARTKAKMLIFEGSYKKKKKRGFKPMASI